MQMVKLYNSLSRSLLAESPLIRLLSPASHPYPLLHLLPTIRMNWIQTLVTRCPLAHQLPVRPHVCPTRFPTRPPASPSARQSVWPPAHLPTCPPARHPDCHPARPPARNLIKLSANMKTELVKINLLVYLVCICSYMFVLVLQQPSCVLTFGPYVFVLVLQQPSCVCDLVLTCLFLSYSSPLVVILLSLCFLLYIYIYIYI